MQMPKNDRADESILNYANSSNRSLRATIPLYIVDALELRKGDALRWKISGNRLIIVVKRSKRLEKTRGQEL